MKALHAQLLSIQDRALVKSYSIYNGRWEHVVIICMCTAQAHYSAYQQGYVTLSLALLFD